MRRWFFRYHVLSRDELESELFERCLRLCESRPACPDPRAGGREPPQQPQASFVDPWRCYIGADHRVDADLPRLLEGEEHARALVRTLTEAAALLYYFARSGPGAERDERHLPS